jgi:serine/threonine protein kinase
MLAPSAGALLGSYELIRAIGSGGMGVVYEARHVTLGRRVAIKVLHTRAVDAATASVLSARFLREGRAAAQVRHPHVVDVFDFGVQEGTAFLVMELVQGETLAQRVEREGKLPLASAVELVLPVLSAVAELHSAGICHRDLKPANILLARARTGEICPKVADFGVSRIDDGSPGITDSGAALGTCAYMSPEQALASKDATERTDQYALGVILYECVTGALPFDGSTPYQLTHAMLHAPLVPPSAHGLPAELDAVILRAMNRDADGRFSCVEELGEALLAFAAPAVAARWAAEFRAPKPSERAPTAPPVISSSWTSSSPRSPSLVKARRATAIGVAALVLAATITGAIALVRSGAHLAEPSQSARPLVAVAPPPLVVDEAPHAAPSASPAAASPPAVAVAPIAPVATAEPRAAVVPARPRRAAAAPRPPAKEPPRAPGELDNGAPILDL